MIYTTPKPIGRGALFAAIVLAMLGMYQIGLAAGIDSAAKYAWSTNAGWINFNPTGGGDVAVYGDHLEGYNLGRECRLDSTGFPHRRQPQYVYEHRCHQLRRQPRSQWDIDRLWLGRQRGLDQLFPTGGGVTIDPQTGAFAGYAWGENIGWISLKGGSGATAYWVVTDFIISKSICPWS